MIAEGLAIGEDDAPVAGVHRVKSEEVEEVVGLPNVVLVDTVEAESLEEGLLLADIDAGERALRGLRAGRVEHLKLEVRSVETAPADAVDVAHREIPRGVLRVGVLAAQQLQDDGGGIVATSGPLSEVADFDDRSITALVAIGDGDGLISVERAPERNGAEE